jgi:hypothetical protein
MTCLEKVKVSVLMCLFSVMFIHEEVQLVTRLDHQIFNISVNFSDYV